ncbi:tetratricopeptide repeat-containing sulfotransferase family protein [Rhodanobacter ginsengisoli]|uniref:Tetratricopeptide repeat-containing sulfotransferase family protein n=1 Tax=Rhodanobacter ginsengisoli TaxID=418646 RepID=A0ABW0QSF9_9GAMM
MAAKQPHPLMQDRAAGLSPIAAGLLRTATVALDRLDPKTAEVALTSVLALEPDCAEALRMQGVVLHLRGDYAEAVTLLRRAHALAPDDAMVQMNLATALYADGEFATAVPYLQRACALAPDFAPAWFNLGKVYMLQGRPAGAITALHRALDVDPDHVPARVLLAQAETALGMVTQASANYREVLRCEPGQPIAWGGLADLDAERLSKEDVVQLRKALHKPGATHPVRVALGFALVKALEDQSDYDGAFRALYKANSLQHRQLNWSPAKASAQVDALIGAFATPPHGASDPTQGEQVIFVVALPQSGSVLTEQVLAAHPQMAAAGDLTDLQQVINDESVRQGRPLRQWAKTATAADWSRLGRDYLARTECWRRRKPCFIDRSLHNWRLVGAALAMLPGARVVNSRRDAFENCFACYRQLFASGYEFTYDLDHMVSYWRDYDRLSRHWQRLFPTRFTDHGYEAWQADPEGQVRRLLDFCGLAFAPACVEFHRKQDASAGSMSPGQLLRRDSERAALYGKNLDRLRALLSSGDTVS